MFLCVCVRRLPDLSAGFAEISSISCSPAQQNIPLSRRPSYSTPRSPHRSVHQSRIPGAPTAVQALPSLQNLLDTHTPSHTPSQESASTSKATEESDEEEADSSAASQSGFLSVSSRQLRETGLAEEGRRGMSGGDVEAESDDQDEEDDRASASVCSGGGVCEAPRSFSPSSSEEEEQPSRTASLAAFEEEEERMLSQEREKEETDDEEDDEDDDGEGSQTEGRPSDDDFISVGDSPDRGPEVEVYDMVRHQPAEGMEETQRASSTLDDVLQGMLEPSSNRRARSPERSANHRARSPERSSNHRARSPGTRLHSRHVMIMEAEMDVEGASSRPGGDTAERQEVASDPPGLVMSAKPDDRAEYQGIWSHPHRVIVLEHTPGKEPYRRTREPQD
ncbi:serine/threonine-protein phosphatase 4 regulatory subunit 2-A-like isoform X2 [Engraulis encrasicolus]|uniref:serine/threonine-protein phosphatase 4 regulatory subunit 2-A-like isoform X2 n=1 Tax=Engraulis encrasicolus TaxID=184585 RepID=UPI002FD48331